MMDSRDQEEEFLAFKMAQVVTGMAQLAGMDPAEVWELQFEGRSVALIETEDSLRAEMSDPDEDGTIHISYRWEGDAA